MFLANILLYMNLLLKRFRGKQKGDRLESYLQATAIWMLCLFVVTEVYSCFHGLGVVSLRISWIVLDLALLAILVFRMRKWQISWRGVLEQSFDFKQGAGKRYHWILIAIAAVTFLLAFFTVPYNWDTMTYRLSRIAYWAQNGSVEHFATSSLRMIANPPMGEFIQLHVYIICGNSDRMLTLIQWAAYITCVVAVHGIARKIKCGDVFAFLASLLFMSMPIAYAQALNTQVDLVATLWLLIFTYLLLDFIYCKEQIVWSGENVFKVCIMGLCVAWGYLTKASVCVAMLVLCLWLLINCVARRDKVMTLLRLAGCALISMALPLSCEISRNLATFHAISSPLAGERQLVGTLKPNFLLVNFFKNFCHNMPNAYLGQATDMIESVMWRLATFLKVGLNEEVISEGGGAYQTGNPYNYGHDVAINPIIMWLMLICIVLVIGRIRNIDWKKWYKSYSLAAIMSFCIFCVVLRWEPYVTRYMVSFLTLLCPMIALQLQEATEGVNKAAVRHATIGIICTLCLLDVVNMTVYHRNICTRLDADTRPYGYFAARTTEYEACMDICQYIKDRGYTQLGIFQSGDDYEYPYWAILQDSIERIEHVNIYDESSVYIDIAYQPECIIWMGVLSNDTFEWNGAVYEKIYTAAENRYVLINSVIEGK